MFEQSYIDNGLTEIYVYSYVVKYSCNLACDQESQHNEQLPDILRRFRLNSLNPLQTFSLAFETFPGRGSDTLFPITMIELCLIHPTLICAFSLNVTGFFRIGPPLSRRFVLLIQREPCWVFSEGNIFSQETSQSHQPVPDKNCFLCTELMLNACE